MADDSSTDEAFDELVAPLDQAMVIVTTAVDGERSGCLVGFHVQSSIEPRRYAVWLSKANHTYGLAVRGEHLLLVHFSLAEGDHDLAELFGGTNRRGRQVRPVRRCDPTGTHGVPLLASAASAHRAAPRPRPARTEGGDHTRRSTPWSKPIEVAGDGSFRPLRLSVVEDHRAPGHEPDD